MKKEKRRKLSDAAIAFIIEERDNPHTVYTFEQIAKLVETEFKISISRNAVSKSYHKHKDDDAFKTLQISKQNSEVDLKSQRKHTAVSDVPKKQKIKRTNNPIVPSPSITDGRDFDEDAGKKHDVSQFF